MYYNANGELKTSKMEYLKGLFALLVGILSICYSAGLIVAIYCILAM